MAKAPTSWRWLLCSLLAGTVWAEDAPPAAKASEASELVWSLGFRLNMDDMRHPGQLGLRPMIGLRYGRWRTGVVDGESWHRFGQVKSDNTLTYDFLSDPRWRTSFSASLVNLQRDSTFDAFQSGRKTLRARATLDYLGWPHWSPGLALTQDLLGRGAGTALNPSLTYRKALSEDSTLLLSQAFTLNRSDVWRYANADNPAIDTTLPSGWGASMDTSLTLRQRWKAHWSWFAQINRNQTLRAGNPTTHSGQSNWSAQAGVVYFEH